MSFVVGFGLFLREHLLFLPFEDLLLFIFCDTSLFEVQNLKHHQKSVKILEAASIVRNC
jgi:hypothetical protein